MRKWMCLLFAFCVILSITALTSIYSSAVGIEISHGDRVFIRGVKSGKYIDVPGGTLSSGEKAQIYEGNQSLAQQWDIYMFSDGFFLIRSALNNRYLLSVNYLESSEGGAAANGSYLILEYFPDGTPIPSRAIFTTVAYNQYGVSKIVNKQSLLQGTLKYVEALYGATGNETKLVQWDTYSTIDTAFNQYWVFESTNRMPSYGISHFVDLLGHCDYSGSTKYQALFNRGVAAWNAYMGTNRFRQDTNLTVNDFTIQDETVASGNPNATASTDYINKKVTFYTSAMDALDGDVIRQKVVMHELGHVLGLDHSSQSGGNIMNQGGFAYWTSLALDDKASYNYNIVNY